MRGRDPEEFTGVYLETLLRESGVYHYSLIMDFHGKESTLKL